MDPLTGYDTKDDYSVIILSPEQAAIRRNNVQLQEITIKLPITYQELPKLLVIV